MDIESLRTLAKRLQVRLGVLEDILEQTGIMSDEKREEMYAIHSAAYDQDEARTLAAAEEDLQPYESGDIWSDDYVSPESMNGEDMSEKLFEALEKMNSTRAGDDEFTDELNDQIQTWAKCGCLACHNNIQSAAAIYDAPTYWDETKRHSEVSYADNGMVFYKVKDDKYGLWLIGLADNSSIYSSIGDDVESCLLVVDPEKVQEMPVVQDDESMEGFGNGVFDEICPDEMVDADESREDMIAELLTIIDQPLLLFGSTKEWIEAVREAASELKRLQ